MHDILPELLKAVKEAYQVNIEQDEEVKRLLNELKSGVADYEKASDYAEHLGDALAKAFQTQIAADKLPDGRMYYNIADRLVNATFRDNYSRIASYCKGTQESLNKGAGIGLKAQAPEFNQNRADGIIERLSEAENYDDVRWILDEPVTNFAMAIVDDHIKANADFQYKAGLSPKIVRTTNGKCCDWCDRLAGTYDYKDVKNTGNDVFRRHRHCRCKVIYDPADGKKVRDVWTKKEEDRYHAQGRENIELSKVTTVAQEAKQLIGYSIRGVEIQGIADHLLKRMAERNVSALDIISTIKEPLKISDTKYNDRGAPSFEVIGEKSTFAINPKSGIIITTHKTHGKLIKKLKGGKDED